MSGIYTGLQARIKSINSLADFVPCSAHSLNLVGKNAASCCHDANEFFRLLQNLYSFFTISTHRWKILNVSLKVFPKLGGQALTTISEDKSVNVSTCCEAKVEIYQSLIGFVHDIRCDDMFNDYKARAIEKCGISSLNTKANRKKKRKRFFDEGNSEENVIEDEFENFKVNTYFMILDQIKSDLEKRKIAYDNLTSNYLRNNNLVEVYPYIDIALRMILCTPATNYSAEQSFSTLKRVKSYLRSTMKEERLNALATLNIESEITRELDYKDIIEEFANKQCREAIERRTEARIRMIHDPSKNVEEFTEIKKMASKILRQDKRAVEKELIQKIEEHRLNLRLFFKNCRSIKEDVKAQTRRVKDHDGNLIMKRASFKSFKNILRIF
ncbi:hypothetical protein AGLY_011966 [Aphis glycines]|uniref:HAT C-terminal dimerisation domain-containing protein n=1 Tax=Aphis glycines TaxID=307491 RepID=A0A6G0TAD5_APHGL|nr:hypothetical protein AGLY_011966 [Aphis glycines]